MFRSCFIMYNSNYLYFSHFQLADMEQMLWVATERGPERTVPPFCHTIATVQAHHAALALLGISVASTSY